jgi:hypothetical protein
MAVVRVIHNKENPYVLVNKKAIQDSNLSLRARGLWALCLSYPNDWKFYVSKLVEECKEGRTAIYTAIDELIENNYAMRIDYYQKGPKGQMLGGGVEYTFFEFQVTKEEKEAYLIEFKKSFPHSGYRDPGNRDTANQPLLSNEEILSTDEIIITPPPEPDKPPPKLVPAGGNNNNFFECLKSLEDIKDNVKKSLMQYSEEIVKDAVRYVYHPTTKLQGPAARTKMLLHFCKHPEDFLDTMKFLDNPEVRMTDKDRVLKHFVKGKLYNGFEYVGDEINGPGFLHSNGNTVYSVRWNEPDWFNKLQLLLKKLNIPWN